jgi:hypothetical protein
MTQEDAGAPAPEPLPKLTMEAAPRYLVGFPFVVAVTYENHLQDVEYYTLPDLSLWSAPWGIGLHLVPVGGGVPYDLEPSHSHGEFREGVPLREGETRRMLLDLSNFGIWLPPGSSLGPRIEPGTYRMTLILKDGGTTTSNPVTVEIVEPDAADAAEAARLRRLGNKGFDNGGWKPFLTSNWTTVVPAPALSFEAQRQLAFYLFLHRAFYGPDPVAGLDESLLGRVTEPSLAADVAAARYEIHAARHAPDARQTLDALLARWPGMRPHLFPGPDLVGKPTPLPLAWGRLAFGPDGPRRERLGAIPYTK